MREMARTGAVIVALQVILYMYSTTLAHSTTRYSRMMPGYDLGAGDFSDFGTHSADPTLCQHACDEHAGCSQWTLTLASGVGTYPYRCCIKRCDHPSSRCIRPVCVGNQTLSTPSANPNCTSGVRNPPDPGAVPHPGRCRGTQPPPTPPAPGPTPLATCQPRHLAPWLPIYHFVDVVVLGPDGKPVQLHGLNDANAVGFSGGYYFVMTQDNFAFAHYRSKDLAHWERLPVALPRPAWDGALSLLSEEDGGPVILYDLPPEPSHLGMARLKNASDAQLISWESYVGGAPLTIDRTKFEPSIQPPNSPTCCSPPGGSVPRCTNVVKPPHCQGIMFPSAIWKDENGKFQMLAATFLNNASWGQKTGRYETADKSLKKWKLVDAEFATGFSEHGGAWFLPVPGSGLISGQSGRYLLNVGGGNEFVVGDYNGHTNTFTNLSTVIHTDFGLWSADWAAIGHGNGRVLQVGWLSSYRLNPQNHAPNALQALSLIREIFYDVAANTLRAMPPAELSLLRNGSLGSVQSRVVGGTPLQLVSANKDSTVDIEATFSLPRNLASASFGLAVFCPPHVATNDDLSLCTKITVHVSSQTKNVAGREGGSAGYEPVRNMSMSVAVPTTPYINATNATSDWFVAPVGIDRDTPVEIRLRVLTDRNIVEAFGADGLASVSILTFPAFADTAAFAFAHVGSGSVAVNISVHSMGCQWLNE